MIVELTEGCGLGVKGDTVTVSEFTGNFLIRLGKANEVRGRIKTAIGNTTENRGNADATFNKNNIEGSGIANAKRSKKPRANRGT